MDSILEVLRSSAIMFIAVDPIGLTAIYIALTENESDHEKKRTALLSSLAAFSVGLLFLFIGQPIFNLLGIQMGDFKIGGGILLVTLSIYDIINPGKRKQADSVSAIVPLGVPFITGPAVLTTLIFLLDNFGYVSTIASFSINIFVVFLAFHFSKFIQRAIGIEGIRGFGKLISILLSAYGIMMIRNGIVEILKLKMLIQ
ncbi:MAG: MarC family protein [Spirochaetia bacterium]|nr:MarC family protein [Spirochaetia bacterium]